MSAKDNNEIKDDWARFERAVDAAVKSGPKRRAADKKESNASGDDASGKKRKPAS